MAFTYTGQIMPKLYYKEKGGYYTRVQFDSKFSTFQISLEGAKILKTLGYENGDNFAKQDFLRLQNGGYLNTMGQGTTTVDVYGEEKLIVKPEGPPNWLDDKYGPGWIYGEHGEYIEILFRQGNKFIFKKFIKSLYLSDKQNDDEQQLSCNRRSLANEVTKVINSQDEAERVVTHILDSIMKALKDHEPIIIEGFGKFFVKVKKDRRKAMEDRNSTVKKWKIVFQPHKELTNYLVTFKSVHSILSEKLDTSD
jgi:nucleoid DNA-binding protein